MMSTLLPSALSQFALDVSDGFSARQKHISARYFYDDLGSALFEAITLLPEYGLTRADEKLLLSHASEIASRVGPLSLVAELGSGSGRKTTHVLRALRGQQKYLLYRPIDVSAAALTVCTKEQQDVADCRPLIGDWMEGLSKLASERRDGTPILLLFLGSSVGNIDREALPGFLRQLRSYLLPGDSFLLGADLVKDVETMMAAYDDPTGITAAFNLNLLGRMNRELGADFDLRSFAHEVRWNSEHRRIEMHLLSGRDQKVRIAALERTFSFCAGETIWTESSHKFNEDELESLARGSGFVPQQTWIDFDWRFAEVLWRVT